MNDKLAEAGGASEPAELFGPFIRLIDVPELEWMPTDSRATVRGWAYRGARGVKLRSQCVGGIRYTTEHWLREFLIALNASASPSTGRDAPPARTTNARCRERERAKRETEEAGI